MFCLLEKSDPFTIPFRWNITMTNAYTCNSLVYQYLSTSQYGDILQPLDGLGFGNSYYWGAYGGAINFHYTSVFHGRFTYRGNEMASLNTNDDGFLFLNGLLAIDLGGVHYPFYLSIDLTYPKGEHCLPHQQVCRWMFNKLYISFSSVRHIPWKQHYPMCVFTRTYSRWKLRL